MAVYGSRVPQSRRERVTAAKKNGEGKDWRPLQGQKALVTGANSGIGRPVALALGAAGADVGVNYVTRPEDADAVVADMRESGTNAIPPKVDDSSESQTIATFRSTGED